MEMITMSNDGTSVSKASSDSKQDVFSTSSPGSARQQPMEYEVFLSFRGPDVRKSFADCLFSCLVRSKIRTFRDEEELCKGEKIAPSLIQAITESKVYIPILTKSYASSKWCLQELAKMVDCWKQGKGHIILPIFYFLDPRDVRHQEGAYKEAFEQHNEKHDPETVQEWRQALGEVGQMKGWHITEAHGQGAVIDQVFSKVELHLRSDYTLVTDDLVGIDFHVQEVTRLLNLDSLDGSVVGIHGMGGIGKTTIAKAVYDKICTEFNRCCFLENIQETLSKSGGVLALQNKVISAILRNDFHVRDSSEGINVIRNRVCKYKVLIILDDVDDRFEFSQVLGKLCHFSSESRFIITTRNKSVLEFLPRYQLYVPKEMSHDHSLQLLSRHAFGMHYPSEDYASLCDEVVKVAAGLPLALKVIGSLLCCREKQFWEEKLMELNEILPTSNRVQQRLKISYNELTHCEKQIFLDIACFFIGENKELPYHMWSDCKLYPQSGIMTLIHRSLIKIDEEDRFWMHDLLRDLGRAIVIEEDVEHPCKRSRIWSNEDALNMFKTGEGTNQVEMLRIDMRDDLYLELTDKEFKKFSGLKYLEVMYGKLTGDFSETLPNMRWLSLNGCCPIPIDLNLQKVVVLDLQYSSVADDWRGWNRIKAAHSKLKVINLYACNRLTRFPDLSQCTSLESIDLTECFGMMGELHIDSFRNLKVLRLGGTAITEVIGAKGKLKKLQEFHAGISGWREAVAPIFPTSLKRLTLSSPWVPNLLELKDLEELSFEQCDPAPEIPGNIWQLHNLKTLRLYKCSSCNGSLLMDQDHGGATALPSSLTCLIFHSCGTLNRLPNLDNLSNLTELRLIDIGIFEIHGLGELRVLEALEISGVSYLKTLHGLKNLLHLKEVILKSCGLLGGPFTVSNLTKLYKLVIVNCPSLIEIQGLGQLGQSLLHFELSGCGRLASIEGLQSLEALESLTLESGDDEDTLEIGWRPLSSLEKSPDLSRLQNLKRLSIMGWKQLSEVIGLQKLNSLQTLVVAACNSLTRLPDLSGLKNLETLDISDCLCLVEVTRLEGLESLEELIVSNCSSIQELPDISGLGNLEELDVSGCTQLSKVVGLERLESLRKLRMNDCRSIKHLPDMSGLKNLENLNLQGCTQLKTVKGLEKLEELWFVEMDNRLNLKHGLKLAAWHGKKLARSVRSALRNRNSVKP